jgi:hypothetical protein
MRGFVQLETVNGHAIVSRITQTNKNTASTRGQLVAQKTKHKMLYRRYLSCRFANRERTVGACCTSNRDAKSLRHISRVPFQS